MSVTLKFTLDGWDLYEGSKKAMEEIVEIMEHANTDARKVLQRINETISKHGCSPKLNLFSINRDKGARVKK